MTSQKVAVLSRQMPTCVYFVRLELHIEEPVCVIEYVNASPSEETDGMFFYSDDWNLENWS